MVRQPAWRHAKPAVVCASFASGDARATDIASIDQLGVTCVADDACNILTNSSYTTKVTADAGAACMQEVHLSVVMELP